MKYLRSSIVFFIHFHKGTVNIVLHIAGFSLLLYGIIVLNWIIVASSIILIELGHIYNHLAKIEPYDFRPQVCFLRALIFLIVVAGMFLLSIFLRTV